MAQPQMPPIGVSLSSDVEYREGRPAPYKARVRWVDPMTKRRPSKSESFGTADEAQAWIDAMERAARGGIDPTAATMRLGAYGDTVMQLAIRGLELKTLDPYMAGWRKRVVPTLGHIPIRMVTTGAVDRAVHGWIADEYSRSTVKNSLAILVRVMEQAVRDGIIDRNPAKVIGWQREYQRAEDELDDPRSLALPDWEALTELDGVTWWSSPPGPLRESERFPACAPRTSTATRGCGRCAARPPPAPGGSSTRAPRENAPGPYRSSSNFGRWSVDASMPRAARTPDCSPGRAAGGSAPPFSATLRTGTTS
jgi:hypothetical protein